MQTATTTAQIWLF